MRDSFGNLTDGQQFFPQGQINYSKSAGTSTFYEFSHRDIVGATNASGAEVAAFSYSPYGEPSVLFGNAQDFGYAGMYYHVRSMMNLTLFRQYNPTLGRWLSRDPLGEGAGTNLYGYVGNNPISFVDSLGLAPGDWFNTPEAAAIDAMKGYNARSIKAGKEISGSVYRDPQSGKYYSTYGVISTQDRSVIPAIPSGIQRVGDWHTHGCYQLWNGIPTTEKFDETNANVYSHIDLFNSSGRKVFYPLYSSSYLAIPDGSTFAFSPGSGYPIRYLGPLPNEPIDTSRWIIYEHWIIYDEKGNVMNVK